MAAPNWHNQTIWTGDNLDIMRGMNSASVDLIYADPPFNSNHNYAAPIGSKAAGAAFKDTWGLDDINLAWHGEIKAEYPALYDLLTAVRTIHGDSMMSYLIYMAVRLMEMKRLLKDSGSLYLHCDPTASHYLKLLLDCVFGKQQFQNEISWKRTSAHNSTKGYGPVHDTVLFYSRGPQFQWNRTFQPYDREYVESFYRHKDAKGRYQIGDLTAAGSRNGESGQPWRDIDPGARHWAPSRSFPGGEHLPRGTHDALDMLDSMGRIYWPKQGRNPRFKRYLDEMPGVLIQDMWTDIRPLSGHAKERQGYPTQKPLALLSRVIKASAPKDGVVLDPFCGCATACIAAEIEGRQWAGIDISAKAADLVQSRMQEELGLFFNGSHRTDIPKRTDLGEVTRYNHPANKKWLYGEQGGFCLGCQEHFQARHLTIDHIIPRAKGGTDHISNLQLLCNSCNTIKGTKTQEELIVALTDKGYIKRKMAA